MAKSILSTLQISGVSPKFFLAALLTKSKSLAISTTTPNCWEVLTMANEKRLISADEIDELFYKQIERGATDLMDAFDDALQDCQTVDAVKLPCKIGDHVWAIKRQRGYVGRRVVKTVVSGMYFAPDMTLQIIDGHLAHGAWGKVFFATKEEADEAMQRGKVVRCE